MALSLARRTAIVTGSARGTGKAIALRLARDGYSICINDTSSSQAAIDATVSEIRSQSKANVIGIPADVSSASAVSSLIKETTERLGPLTLMIANAGVSQVKPLLSVTDADMGGVMSVNFNGVVNCYTAAARQMISQGDPKDTRG